MSLLSIAIQQAQLRPQYHPSYSTEPKGESGRPLSKLRQLRREKLHTISLEIGEAMLSELLAEIHKTDPKINKDDCRNLLNELCSERKMDKRVAAGSVKRVLYKARPR